MNEAVIEGYAVLVSEGKITLEGVPERRRQAVVCLLLLNGEGMEQAGESEEEEAED